MNCPNCGALMSMDSPSQVFRHAVYNEAGRCISPAKVVDIVVLYECDNPHKGCGASYQWHKSTRHLTMLHSPEN